MSTDPEEESDDFDFDEDAEPITIISCVELRHLEKIASNAMFLIVQSMKTMYPAYVEEFARLYELLKQSVLAYNEWLEKEKKNDQAES